MSAATAGDGRSSRGHEYAIALLCGLPGALVFFRRSFASAFDKIFGNSGDARLLVFLSEHWVRVLHGQTTWRNLEVFYPAKDVLGYSDTLLVNEIFYAPLRVAGADPFLAFQWTLVLISLVGSTSLYLLLRRAFGLQRPASILLTSTAVFANSLYLQSGHLQLFSLHWLPLLLLICHGALTARGRRRRCALAATAGLLFGTLLYSSYYIAWFAALAALLFAVSYGAVRLVFDRRGISFANVRSHLATAASFVAGAVPPLVLFVVTYLPVLRSSGGRNYADAMQFALRPADLVNVSGTNYLWGSLMRSSLSAPRLRNTEIATSPTPVLLLVALVCTVTATTCLGVRNPQRRRAFVTVALGLTTLGLLLLPVRFGAGSLWRVPWTLVPGAVGIRAIGRLGVVTSFVAVLTVASGLVHVARGAAANSRGGRIISAAALIVLGVVVVEQLNFNSDSRLDRSDEIAALTLAPPPPAGCTAFFVVDSVSGAIPRYAVSTEAMLLSQHFDLPTLNGYSGQAPEGYDLNDAYAPDYRQAVDDWASDHGIGDGLCSYDRSTRTWS